MCTTAPKPHHRCRPLFFDVAVREWRWSFRHTRRVMMRWPALARLEAMRWHMHGTTNSFPDQHASPPYRPIVVAHLPCTLRVLEVLDGR
ncbi:hypothetical protein BAUCODRAFT_238169 [Baudoinia panamericana UAMH 10762]|uniref:Uncharacterized protein n=1 Tax=Baudoinia panamericana (strain UAMH 10762) TaxID=717646 RepID=M2LGY1_BAUPA|nr:uncharacterized protein BAUCODRAFT_238169 [Baudoinia panamericana UAMH 10762]EMC93372.1 hypothetical protein BAUCODRAFT_238169 [Baudoinia panamericana UAMH 10762]